MKKFLQKQREIMIILAYILLIGALIYFAILPLMRKINAAKDQAEQGAADYEILKQRINDLPKMRLQHDMLSQEEEALDILLKKDSGAVALIEKLEKMAENTGNKITISVQEQQQNQPQQKTSSTKKATADEANVLINGLPSQEYLQMKIEITGKYNTIVNYINSLETLRYYADITSIEIGRSDDQGQANMGITFDSLPGNQKNSPSVMSHADEDLKAKLNVVFYTKK